MRDEGKRKIRGTGEGRLGNKIREYRRGKQKGKGAEGGDWKVAFWNVA